MEERKLRLNYRIDRYLFCRRHTATAIESTPGKSTAVARAEVPYSFHCSSIDIECDVVELHLAFHGRMKLEHVVVECSNQLVAMCDVLAVINGYVGRIENESATLQILVQ